MVGVDIAPDMIRTAQATTAARGLTALEFAVNDYESMAFSEEFDAVLFFDSLHHAEDEAEALRCAYRALRPGGTCVLSEPGIGHHETVASRHAIEAFNVTEKEMPPYRAARLARAAGFSRTRTYAHQGQIFTLLNQEPSASSGHTRLRRLVLGSRALRPVLAFLLMAFLKRWSGVMVLTK